VSGGQSGSLWVERRVGLRPLSWRPPVELSPAEQQVVKRIRRAKLFVMLRQRRHELFSEQSLAAGAGLPGRRAATVCQGYVVQLPDPADPGGPGPAAGGTHRGVGVQPGRWPAASGGVGLQSAVGGGPGGGHLQLDGTRPAQGSGCDRVPAGVGAGRGDRGAGHPGRRRCAGRIQPEGGVGHRLGRPGRPRPCPWGGAGGAGVGGGAGGRPTPGAAVGVGGGGGGPPGP
jgi:hypothetical protein